MSDPPYLTRVLSAGGATPFAVERGILREWKSEWSRDKSGPFWHEEEITHIRPIPPQKVRGWSQHFLRYIKLLLPRVQVNPWLVEMIQSVERTYFIEGRKIANFIGSKNSGKTTFFSIMAHAIVSIWPEYSRCYISGPYKSAADATIWGRVSTQFSTIERSPHHTMTGLRNMPSRGRYIYDETSEEAGYVELVTLDKVGKLQGAKSMHTEKGMLLLICDEISTFPSRALLDALGNLTGNKNFLCLTGCNFRDTEGLEGDLCRPDGREFSEINPEIDFSWKSAHKSMTYRFDGHHSPNVVYNKEIYSYLLTENVRKDMEDIHGLNGPKYLEQIRSAPISTMSDFYVTSRERIKASGAHEPVVWEGEDNRVAFCDPGFGGDPCKVGVFRFGPARIQKTDGTFSTMNVFAPIEPIHTIKLEKDRKADEEWIARLSNIIQGQMFLRPEAPVTLENQIVLQVAEYCRKHGIPFSRLGFDGSMRSAIVHEFVAVLGPQVVSMDFGGMPTERSNYLVAGKRACDEYANFVTELWFNVGGVLQSGQFRNADMVPAAIAQLCRRSWKHMGNKKQIQIKADFKEHNQGRSPDDADVLVGAFEMALRNGFVTVTRRRPEAAEFSMLAAGSLTKLMGHGRIITTFGSKRLQSVR